MKVLAFDEPKYVSFSIDKYEELFQIQVRTKRNEKKSLIVRIKDEISLKHIKEFFKNM